MVNVRLSHFARLSFLLWSLQAAGCGSGIAVPPYVLPVFAGGTPAFALYHAYGDSVTYGLTLSSPATQAYSALVAKSAGLELSNYGTPGDQSCDVARTQVFAHQDLPKAGDHGLYTLVIGTNDTNLHGPGPYEAVFNLCQQAVVTWLAVPEESKVLATAAGVTVQGPTTLETASHWNAVTTGAPGASVTLPFNQPQSGVVYLWYRLKDYSPASFQYGVDGVPAGIAAVGTTPVMQTQNGGGDALGVVRLAGVAAGHHTLTVSQVNAGDSGVGVVGVGVVPPAASPVPTVWVGTTPKTLSSSCASCDIYRADIRANVQLLAGDGLNLRVFESGKYMQGTTADMSDGVHPNALGQTEIAHALLDALGLSGTAKVMGQP